MSILNDSLCGINLSSQAHTGYTNNARSNYCPWNNLRTCKLNWLVMKSKLLDKLVRSLKNKLSKVPLAVWTQKIADKESCPFRSSTNWCIWPLKPFNYFVENTTIVNTWQKESYLHFKGLVLDSKRKWATQLIAMGLL